MGHRGKAGDLGCEWVDRSATGPQRSRPEDGRT